MKRKYGIFTGQKIKWMISTFAGVLLIFLACGSVSAATLYVAKTGSDSNPGTQSQPFLTINKAAQTAYAGDTVIVSAGEYREWVRPARGGTSDSNRITYKSAPGETVVIKGSERITSWVQHSGNTWRVTLPNSYFGGYNPYTARHGLNENDYFPVYNCGDVYLNGEAFYQKGSLSEVTANGNTWYSSVDASNTTLYANFGGANPNTGTAEINVRKQCFAPSVWGLGYITVDGFTIAHAANSYSDFPGYPQHAQAGAVSVYGGLKWIIQNNTIINARSIGIDIGLGCDEWAGNKGTAVRTYYYNSDQYGQHIVKNNFITKCGQSGICGVFSWKSQVLYNTIEKTNYRNEFCNAETAGIKLHYDNDGLIEGNYVKDTVGPIVAGIWTDWGNQGIRITKNILVNNAMSYYAEAVVGPILVDNNVFVSNNHLRSLDSAGVVFVHNLFYNEGANFDGTGRDCYVFTPHSMAGARTVRSSPQYFRFLNNIFIGCSAPTPPGTNNLVSFNCSNVGSGFTYRATSSSFSCNFNMDGSPFTSRPLITDGYIGNIQPANQGIGVTVDRDYFGGGINTSSPVAGPFADIKNGANTYTLWPRSGITPPAPPPSETNLALYRPVTVSSTADGTVGASAVDGSAATRWSSAYSDPQWIYVDLGSSRSISSVRLSWEAAYGKAFKIQVSNDASAWSDVYSTTTGTGGVQSISFSPTNARYVRMYGTQRGTTYGYSLWEFEVYGGSAAPNDVSVGGTASDGGAANPAGEDETKAFDKNNNTKWLVYSPTGVLQYDFAGTAAYKVTAYSVTSANDDPARDPRNWQLQGSNDGTNWTTVDTRSGITFASRFQTNTYSIANNTAYQMYRLNITANNGSGSLLQLAELQLFGN